MIQDLINDVRLFHQTFGHPILPKPAIPSPERQVLRNKLMRDEWLEELDPAWAKCAVAHNHKDSISKQSYDLEQIDLLAEFGDAIADVIYFLIGTALEYGIPLDQIWAAVQEANMSKLWTEKEIAQDGTQMNILECGWKATINEVAAATGTTRCWSVVDQTGKVRKPPSWKEPDIKAIIRKAMQ